MKKDIYNHIREPREWLPNMITMISTVLVQNKIVVLYIVIRNDMYELCEKGKELKSKSRR